MRKIPKADNPSAELFDKVSDLKAWSKKNPKAAAWIAEYFYDFKELAKHTTRFSTVGRVRTHHMNAMKLWNFSTPTIDMTSPPTKPIDSALMAVFGDNASKKVTKSEVIEFLNAMVWACQP